MKYSTKAVLLSCFAFPGAGHLYLKRYLPGLLLSFATAVAIFLIVSGAVQTALEVAQQIESGRIPLDVETITALVTQLVRASEDTMNNLLISLILLWLIGIFDSYRVGYLLDKSLRPGDKNGK